MKASKNVVCFLNFYHVFNDFLYFVCLSVLQDPQ